MAAGTQCRWRRDIDHHDDRIATFPGVLAMQDQEQRHVSPTDHATLARPALAAGPRHASLVQLSAVLNAAPAVARTAAAARLLQRVPRGAMRPLAKPAAVPGQTAQRVVIDAKRPGWKLDRFDDKDQIYTDLAGRLGYGDAKIEEFEKRFPNLYAEYVVPENVQVDIGVMAEQAILGVIRPPAALNSVSAGRQAVGSVIDAASSALHAAKVTFVVQGSGAQMLLGAAPYTAPDDVDIIVNNMVAGSQALRAAGFVELMDDMKENPVAAAAAGAAGGAAGNSGGARAAVSVATGKTEGGSLAVRKFRHGPTGKTVDLVMEAEMGPAIKYLGREDMDGTTVLSPLEAIKAINYRIQVKGERPKDIQALIVLATKNRFAFSAEQRAAVEAIVRERLGEKAIPAIFAK